MPFEKGHKKYGGKTKGTENKITQDIKLAFKQLVENNLENMTKWLKEIAETDPAKAMKLIIEMSEYNIPKLNRTTHDIEGNKSVEIKVIHEKDKDNLSKL